MLVIDAVVQWTTDGAVHRIRHAAPMVAERVVIQGQLAVYQAVPKVLYAHLEPRFTRSLFTRARARVNYVLAVLQS